MTPDWISQAEAYFALIATAGGAAGAWRWIVQPLRRAIQEERLFRAGLAETLPAVRDLAQELQPNNGRSLRDTVDRIETRLALSDHRSRLLIAHMRVGAWESDADGSWTWISQELARIMGLETHAARGNGWLSALHPEDRDRVAHEWRESVQRRYAFRSEFRFLHPSGRVNQVRGESEVLLREGTGAVLGFLGTITLLDGEPASAQECAGGGCREGV